MMWIVFVLVVLWALWAQLGRQGAIIEAYFHGYAEGVAEERARQETGR